MKGKPLLSVAIICLLIGAARSAPARHPRAANLEVSSLVGLWKEIFVSYEGIEQTYEYRRDPHWLITADTITMFDGPNIHDANRGGWHYKLTPGNGPMALDLISSKGHPNQITYPCLIQLEEDKLTLCLQNSPDRGRPTDFVSRPQSMIGRFVFVRVKE